MASTDSTNSVIASGDGRFAGVGPRRVTPAESAQEPRGSHAMPFWMDGKGREFSGRENAAESLRGDQVKMGLDGPSRTIIVEPIEAPVTEPAYEPEPERVPDPTPERDPEKVPA